MTSYAYFFTVLILIYLIECFLVIDKNSIIIYSHFLRRWEYIFPEKLLSFGKMILFLCNPLPPLGMSIPCTILPMAISPKGIAPFSLFNKANKIGNPIPYKDMKTISRSEKDLIINQEKIIRLHNPLTTGLIYEALKKIISRPETERETLITHIIKSTMDVEEIRLRYGKYKKMTLQLRIVSNGLFLFLFILFPFAQHFKFLDIQLWKFLIILLLLMLMILGEFIFAHRSLFKDKKSNMGATVASMVFSPPLAIRANDFLLKKLLADYHPIAVGNVLLDKDKFRQLSYRIMRQLYFSINENSDDGQKTIVNWFCKTYLKVIEQCFGNEFDLETALHPPIKENSSIRAYCPLCHSQYRKDNEECIDCGIDLILYKHDIIRDRI